MKVSNKSIRIITLWAVLILLQSTASMAQHGPRGRKGPSLDKMKTELQLSNEQVTKIEVVVQNYHEKMKTVREQDGDDFQARKTQMQRLMGEQQKEIAAILTQEQKEKMEALNKKRNEEMQQRRQGNDERLGKTDKEALRTELDNYKTNKVQPVMLAQRAKLEKIISVEDKATIEDLRLKFTALENEIKEKRKEIRNGRKEAYPSPKGSHRNGRYHDAMNELMESNKENVETLKALVAKYDQEIIAVLKEIEGKQEQWKKDRKAIVQKYLKNENYSHETGAQKGMHKNKGDHKDNSHTSRRMPHKGHFLLLDPNEKMVLQPTAALSDIKVYPSPATNSNKIEFEVSEAGRIRIDIVDSQGKIIRKVSDELRDPGAYSLDVDLSDLKGMVFYYRITDKNGVVSSKKFMIARE